MKLSRIKIQVKAKTPKPDLEKHRNKKLNTLGGYAGRVMVGDRKTTYMYSGWHIKSSNRQNAGKNYPEDHTWSRQPMTIIYPVG